MFICQCADGFGGDICEAEFNECESDPCIHGNCSDMINGYSCLCEGGFEGDIYDGNINLLNLNKYFHNILIGYPYEQTNTSIH